MVFYGAIRIEFFNRIVSCVARFRSILSFSHLMQILFFDIHLRILVEVAIWQE